MPNFISEDQIEQALVQKLQHLHGFDVLDCNTQDPESLNDGSNRTHKRDVILADRVKEAAVRLNPHIPETAIDEALEKLLDRRLSMSLIAANQEVYGLIRDGIPVEYDDANGQKQNEHVALINFNDAAQNRYLAVTQLWVKGEHGFRRPDVLLYVNGLPLVFIELKNSNVKLKAAYDDNYFDDLMKFTKELREEDERHVREGLSEDELELFDLLKKEEMTKAEIQNVRLAAKALLHRLLEEHPKVLVQDWYKDNQSQKVVRSAVEKVLDSNLPETYDRAIFKAKCDNVFDLIVDQASHGRKWA